jgi:hypothetical protein
VNPPNKVPVLQDHSHGSDAGQQRWVGRITMPGGLSIRKVDPFTGVGMLLKYKDGEKTIVVPSDATVGNLIPGDKADLLPRAKNIHPALGEDSRWDLGSNSRARGP